MIPHRYSDRLLTRLVDYRIALVITIIACVAFWYGWRTAPQRLWIDILPDLSQGASIRPFQRQHPNIYMFTWMLMTKLNQWSNDGKKDFPTQIELFRPYITASGEYQLVQLLNCKSQLQELSGRRRNVNLVDFYNQNSVKTIDDQTWLVTMKFEIVERIDDMVTKRPVLLFKLYIVNHRTDPSRNFWGLGFAGFENFDEIMGGRCESA